jgi:hypothetical protein
MPIDVKDAAGATRSIETPNANGRAAAAASRPVAFSNEDKAALDLLETRLSAIIAKIIAAPATEALQSAGNTTLSAIQTALGTRASEATLAAVLAKIIAAPATEARQVDGNTLLNDIKTLLTTEGGYLDGVEGLLGTIGTRAYGTPLARRSVGAASAQSGAVNATEVMLHASTRCFVATGVNPTATADSIPLEAGEKFHMRITSGHLIAVIRESADGFLNIVPVA